MNTHILDEVIMAKRKKREEVRLEQIEKAFVALEELAKEVNFKEAFIFGSLSKPYAFYPDSDIDIGFMGLKDDDYFKVVAFLSSKLGKDVDIIQLEEHRLKDKIIKEGIKWKRPDLRF